MPKPRTQSRTATFKLAANAGKLAQLRALVAECQAAGQFVLELYQQTLRDGRTADPTFRYKDPARKIHIDTTVYRRCCAEYPRLYSKTVQKICKTVVTSTLARSVKKLFSTDTISVPAIFDRQMFDIRIDATTKFPLWVRFRGLGELVAIKPPKPPKNSQTVPTEPVEPRFRWRYPKIKLPLVGAYSTQQALLADSIDELRFVEKLITDLVPKKTRHRHNQLKQAAAAAEKTAATLARRQQQRRPTTAATKFRRPALCAGRHRHVQRRSGIHGLRRIKIGRHK